jgi:hypothetical protein
MYADSIFDRAGSTLGVMDDLQFAIHTYDGCSRGCPGCLVDKHFKNDWRFRNILSHADMALINQRAHEYFQWAQDNLNTKQSGYFGQHHGGYKVNHFSYTFRFGNHAELPTEELIAIAEIMQSGYRVFSTGPTDDLSKFIEVKNKVPGRYFLEIIYDPMVDKAETIRAMILDMRANGILGYPEVLITRRLLDSFSPERFVAEAVAPMGDIGAQMQFGRYSPSKTRAFKTGQVVPLDEEVEWMTTVADGIIRNRLDIHPIPIAEYAVTLLDEYKEHQAVRADGSIDETLLPDLGEFRPAQVRDKVRDIFLTSLYIDHNLDLYVWSESMGQHVLDNNFGYRALGNIRERSIADIVTEKGGVLEQMLNAVVRDLITNRKCARCRYKSFCASHAIPLFRKWHQDDGKHCYGYLPVIRAFQRDQGFLKNMIDGFRDLDF